MPAPGTKNGGKAIGPPPACIVDGVELTAGGAEAVAVALVSGYVTPEIAQSVRQRLVDAIVADGLKVHAEDADGVQRRAFFSSSRRTRFASATSLPMRSSSPVTDLTGSVPPCRRLPRRPVWAFLLPHASEKRAHRQSSDLMLPIEPIIGWVIGVA